MTCTWTWMDDVTELSHGIQPQAVAWAHHSGIGPITPVQPFPLWNQGAKAVSEHYRELMGQATHRLRANRFVAPQLARVGILHTDDWAYHNEVRLRKFLSACGYHAAFHRCLRHHGFPSG